MAFGHASNPAQHILAMNKIVLRHKSNFIIQLRWTKTHQELEFITAVGKISSQKFQNRKSGSGTLIYAQYYRRHQKLQFRQQNRLAYDHMAF